MRVTAEPHPGLARRIDSLVRRAGLTVQNRAARNEPLVTHHGFLISPSDDETILQLVARSQSTRVMDRFVDALRQIEGAYALVALTPKKLIGARDPLGIRPLILGRLNGAPILCSETVALDIIGADFVREIEPGEIVICTREGIESLRPFPGAVEF